MMKCLNCGAEEKLQICYPTWFRFTSLRTPLDGNTLLRCDIEDNPGTYCEECNAEHTYADYYNAYNTETKTIGEPCRDFPFKLSDLEWEDNSFGISKGCRLHTTIKFLDTSLHLEALEVKTDTGGCQVAASPDIEDELQDWSNAAGGDGPFQTTTINGRTYAVFIAPFCD